MLELWRNYKTGICITLVFLVFLYLSAHIPAFNNLWGILGYYITLILTNVSSFISMMLGGATVLFSSLSSLVSMLLSAFSLLLTGITTMLTMMLTTIMTVLMAILTTLQMLANVVLTIFFNFFRMFANLLTLLPGMLSDLANHAPELMRTVFTHPAELMSKLMSYPNTREFIQGLLSPIGKLIRDVIQNLFTKEGRHRIWYAIWHLKK